MRDAESICSNPLTVRLQSRFNVTLHHRKQVLQIVGGDVKKVVHGLEAVLQTAVSHA